MLISFVGLEISVPTLIWTVINFFLLLFLLNKLLFKPILKHMDDRKADIEAGLKAGQEAKVMLEKTEEKLKEDLTETGTQARLIVSDGKNQDEKDRTLKLEETHKQVRALREEKLSDIQSEEESARNDVQKNIDQMVDVLTQSLLHSEE